jgi:anti-sigma regulatory factor (Ser/Thr protein kinase)
MGLSRILGVKPTRAIKEHEPAGRFIPLTVIKDSSGLTDFIREIVPLLHLQPDQAEPIKYVISELVRNVLEHANSSNGAVLCVQYYKKSNSIKIGIADRGVGIKNTINVSHRADTHLDAIRLALMPGITGTTPREGGTETNAGAGLFFIKSIAKINKEFFVIYSGNAMYKLLKGGRAVNHVRLHADPFEDKHSGREDLPFWNGTVVGIDISLDSTREFSLLLDAIRETYLKAVKERKQERYRRPKFI